MTSFYRVSSSRGCLRSSFSQFSFHGLFQTLWAKLRWGFLRCVRCGPLLSGSKTCYEHDAGTRLSKTYSSLLLTASQKIKPDSQVATDNAQWRFVPWDSRNGVAGRPTQVALEVGLENLRVPISQPSLLREVLCLRYILCLPSDNVLGMDEMTRHSDLKEEEIKRGNQADGNATRSETSRDFAVIKAMILKYRTVRTKHNRRKEDGSLKTQGGNERENSGELILRKKDG